MRTTPSQVEGIIEVDSDTWPDITPFIEIANDLVTEKCTASGYTDARLELIERWLSAHFYAIADPRTTSERADTVGESFQHKIGLGFALTHYGQQAMLLDTKGNLASLNNVAKEIKLPKNFGVTYLGTTAHRLPDPANET